ncbi:hypothetical protein SAMN02745135_01950 [Caloranaerobacter azorensis DSM 13643]|uniref:Uncharacterized protein n=2 Tax=Caloranaerobacter azorensis TaxID=116090 RepID=A0A1M5VIH3_9FIRM|nr:hypothetical protein SAMN02745135_01950 [Caloranaerobacter azorensis DSM 13643]
MVDYFDIKVFLYSVRQNKLTSTIALQKIKSKGDDIMVQHVIKTATRYKEIIKDFRRVIELRRKVDKRQSNFDPSIVVSISGLLTYSQPILSFILSVAGTAIAIANNIINTNLEKQEDFYTYIAEEMVQKNWDTVKFRQKYSYVKTYNQEGAPLYEGWIVDGKTELAAYHSGSGWVYLG